MNEDKEKERETEGSIDGQENNNKSIGSSNSKDTNERTNEGQTSLSCFADMDDGTHRSADTNSQGMNGSGLASPSSSRPTRQAHTGVNVEAAAHLSCSAGAEAEGSSNHSQDVDLHSNETSEMAIVSENMAHASITPASAGEQRPGGASVESSETQAPKAAQEAEDSNAGVNTVFILPAVAAAAHKPTSNEGKRKKKRSAPQLQPGQSSGRWTHAEHEAFLEGLRVFGREWKKVAVRIPTRTSSQVRSHAQKYFSKLTRDEQLMNQESQAFEAAVTTASATGASAAASNSNTAAAEALAAAQAHTPSVQRNVDRILADPEQAQRDVEDTLRALRERYQQLQQRLQEHQAQHHRQGSPTTLIEEEKENDNEQRQRQHQDVGAKQQRQEQGPMQRGGKRRRGETNGDDCSMSSSTLSSLGNEELIALSVLGATLPNGGVAHPAAPAAEGPGHARQRSSSSLDSNSTSNSNASKSAKRKREDAD